MPAASTSIADIGRKKLKSVKGDLIEGRFQADIASSQKVDNQVDWLVYQNVKLKVKEKTGEVIYQSFDALRNRYEER
jgi:hypothetical protein